MRGRTEEDLPGPEIRESPLSVARKWLPWCLAIIFAMTIGWTALVAWEEVSNGDHTSLLRTAIAIVHKSAPATPSMVIYAIMTVTVVDLLGGSVVVTARYLGNKFVEPLIEKHKAEGRAEGLEEGRAEERLRWSEWNQRRIEAEARGASFDEPPPAP